MCDRIAIFAHYDKKNVVDDYVLFYIKELQKVAQQVIFVSCCDLPQEELDKLDCIKIAKKHQEYDFGSYKIGFNYAKKHKLLNNCDELIFANDSCYGPFKSLSKIFEKMQDNSCDYWGLTKNKYGIKIKNGKARDIVFPHIQSYFFVVRPDVFNSKAFDDFLNSVTVEENKINIIYKYELGFNKVLENADFKSDYAIKGFHENNPTIFNWRKLYKNSDFPFIKCSLLRLQNYLHTTVAGWQKLLDKNQVEMINKNLEYTSRVKPMRKYVPKTWKEFVFRVIPKGSTKRAAIARLLLRTFFKFLTD